MNDKTLSWHYSHVMQEVAKRGTKAFCERCGCGITDPAAKKRCRPTRISGL